MMEQYTKGDRRFKILFMCRDNATTSVVAEAIFRDLIERRGCESAVFLCPIPAVVTIYLN